MGRLTKAPEIRYSNDNKAVARFSIAVDRRFKREGQPEADFFNCTAFAKQAEFVEKWLTKGTKVVLTGSLQNNNYTDKNGVQRYDVQILVDEIEFAESKNLGIASSNAPSDVPQNKADADGFMQIPDLDDELPFS